MSSKKAKKETKPAPKSKSKLASLKNMLLGSGKKAQASAKNAKKAHKEAKPAKAAPVKPTKVAKPVKAEKAEKSHKGAKKAHAPEVVATPPKKGKAASATKKAEGGKKGASHAALDASHPLDRRVDAHGQPICREVACEGLATTGDYCRQHYIKNWKKIKRKELILKEKKLNRYIEELVSKYPDKYIEVIRQDLSSERDFGKVIHDLDLDESIEDIDSDMESIDSLIDSIRRDIDDEGEVY